MALNGFSRQLGVRISVRLSYQLSSFDTLHEPDADRRTDNTAVEYTALASLGKNRTSDVNVCETRTRESVAVTKCHSSRDFLQVRYQKLKTENADCWGRLTVTVEI